jgi:hypothetical protein
LVVSRQSSVGSWQLAVGKDRELNVETLHATSHSETKREPKTSSSLTSIKVQLSRKQTIPDRASFILKGLKGTKICIVMSGIIGISVINHTPPVFQSQVV